MWNVLLFVKHRTKKIREYNVCVQYQEAKQNRGKMYLLSIEAISAYCDSLTAVYWSHMF